MIRKISILLIFILSMVYLACSDKDEKNELVNGEVKFYLLESFNTGEGNQQIIESSVKLEEQVFLEYEDLLSYNSSTHVFKIADDKKDLFSINGNTVHYRAFALVVDDDIIYTGYFWPEFSSLSVNWYIISPIKAELVGELQVKLGYPGVFENNPIPDLRNDNKIIEIFKRDNKLIE